jgi:hypothetical protein
MQHVQAVAVDKASEQVRDGGAIDTEVRLEKRAATRRQIHLLASEANNEVHVLLHILRGVIDGNQLVVLKRGSKGQRQVRDDRFLYAWQRHALKQAGSTFESGASTSCSCSFYLYNFNPIFLCAYSAHSLGVALLSPPPSRKSVA